MLKLERADEAEQAFDRLTKENPGWAEAWDGLGWSRLARDARGGARRAFHRALEAAPGLQHALDGLTEASGE